MVAIMKKTTRPMCTLILSLGAMLAAAVDVVIVDVQDEPRHHVVFENSSVRIIDVRLPPGDTTLYHRHRRDNLAILMGDGSRAVQVFGKEMSPVLSGKGGDLILQRVEGDGLVHRVSNRGQTPLGFTDIEFVKPTGRSGTTGQSALKPLEENEFYRAYRLTLAPNETSPPLSVGPGVRVIVAGDVQAVGVDGNAADAVRASDFSYWHEAGNYQLRNVGSLPALVVEVELK